MKKLILLLFVSFLSLTTFGQQHYDLVIEKTTPMIHLKGTGGVINLNNGDVLFTLSSNLVTLSGGNFSLGSNSLLGTGSIGSTGSGKFLKGWFVDSEFTNYPTVSGVSMSALLVPSTRTVNGHALTSNVTVTATDVNLGNVTNESKTTMFSTIPAGSQINASAVPTIPIIYSGAGDTSLYPVPGKIGNIYINTSGSKVYVSKSAVRGGWLILN